MKIDVTKDWCVDAAKREGGQEVGAGGLAADPLGPIMQLRLQLTEAQNEIVRLNEVIGGQAYDLEQRAEEFQILSAEVARLNAALTNQNLEEQ